MKVRTGFVTNSSTSSFILSRKDGLTKKEKEKILEYIEENMLGKLRLTPESTESDIKDFCKNWGITDKKEDEIRMRLKEGKSIYSGAICFEDVCYAYIVIEDGVILYKSSDDGEPSQTAGAPILNVIKRNNLTNVLCAVVRYFGGIKLGAGGLVRAYTNSAALVVNDATIVTLVDAYKYKLVFPYERIKDIDKYLEVNQVEILEKEYDMKVGYTILNYDINDIENIKNKISYLGVEFIELGKITTRKKV